MDARQTVTSRAGPQIVLRDLFESARQLHNELMKFA